MFLHAAAGASVTYGDGFSVLPAGYRPRVFPVRGTHGWRQWRISGMTVLDEWQSVRHGTWRARMAAELWRAIYG